MIKIVICGTILRLRLLYLDSRPGILILNQKVLPVKNDWKIGSFRFDVRYTPGHSPDHLSLYNKNSGIVIAGDTLFKGGVGRTDLYKGDMRLLKASIREQLYSLPDSTIVYPGHGPDTTIGHEKQANPFVTG